MSNDAWMANVQAHENVGNVFVAHAQKLKRMLDEMTAKSNVYRLTIKELRARYNIPKEEALDIIQGLEKSMKR